MTGDRERERETEGALGLVTFLAALGRRPRAAPLASLMR
jgi:hypothetical protein